MLGAICGDIIGSVFEFNNYKAKDFELFNINSTFTDDTVLTAAVADGLLNNKTYASCVRNYFRLYPDAGFSPKFSQWANSNQQIGYGSFGNGSAMRISPIGWAFETLEEVLEQAEAAAIITHSHPEGIKGAQVVAGVIFIARNGGTKLEIREFVEKFDYDLNFTLSEIRESYQFDTTCQGSVPQALVAFLESTNFEDAVRNAVSIGGDSDTLASIAGGIAEAYYREIPNHIKDRCLDILDERIKNIYSSFAAKFMHYLLEQNVPKSPDRHIHVSTLSDIPLLSFDRLSILGKATFSHWEKNRQHYISIDDSPCFIGQVFDGWSAKVALDKVRESFEKKGLLIAVEGSLVYAVYSGMCHDMGQGYAGYNYKNRRSKDMTIPDRISTFKIVSLNEQPFVSSLADQQEYSNTDIYNVRNKIIKQRSKNKFPWLSKLSNSMR